METRCWIYSFLCWNLKRRQWDMGLYGFFRFYEVIHSDSGFDCHSSNGCGYCRLCISISLCVTLSRASRSPAIGHAHCPGIAVKYSIMSLFQIFNSKVKSALLHACESWLVSKQVTDLLQTFVNRYLRRILKIYWPAVISNQQL
jgi:hypothetical protein